MNVCAGIILYNPDIQRLKENIEAILPQVEHLVLVDNFSGNIEEVQKEFKNKHIIWIKNGENRGIAAALNQLIDFASKNSYEWILTLDQDSICEEDLVEKLLVHAMGDDKIAMAAPLVIDRGISETVTKKGKTRANSEEIKMCISSGSLTNVEAVRETGGFDEWLFMYDVDREICIRLLRKGYKLIRVNITKLYHEHGLKTVTRRFLWKKIVYRNYSPTSVYYMTRNLLYMLRKYGKEYSPSPFLRRVRMYIAFIIKFIFEPNRLQRLKSFSKGVKEGKAADINETREVSV